MDKLTIVEQDASGHIISALFSPDGDIENYPEHMNVYNLKNYIYQNGNFIFDESDTEGNA